MRKCQSCGIKKSDKNFIKKTFIGDKPVKKCESCRAVSKKYYMANRLQIIKRQKKRNNTHTREYMFLYMKKIKDAVFKKLGNKCKGCGFKDRRALQIDHVNSDGCIENRVKSSGYLNSFARYKKVMADKKGRYQILCANCNWIKRHDLGEHN